jgi:hypothetical protein
MSAKITANLSIYLFILNGKSYILNDILLDKLMGWIPPVGLWSRCKVGLRLVFVFTYYQCIVIDKLRYPSYFISGYQ